MHNDNDKTVAILPIQKVQQVMRVRIAYTLPEGTMRSAVFNESFVIGRGVNCQVQLDHDGISRRHLEVQLVGQKWWIQDLGSSNGTYFNDSRIDRTLLDNDATVTFYSGGPVIKLTLEPSPACVIEPGGRSGSSQTQTASAPHKAQHIVRQIPSVRDSSQLPRRGRTQLKPDGKHRKHFLLGMSTMALILLPAIGYIIYLKNSSEDDLEASQQVFYQTKALELQLSLLRRELAKHPDKPEPGAVSEGEKRLSVMQERYTKFREEIQLIGGHRSKEDLLIFRIARIFGEYDLNIPDDFLSEVKRYIHKWQQSNRLANSIERIHKSGYAKMVAREMQARGLPANFIYLAVQESNFKYDAIGPQTRFGIAKGMWQFIPKTAKVYGLRPGPKKDQPVYDRLDERFNIEKATRAAAEYLSFLYTTEAQASGLLVMSAYNWGEGNVERVLSRFPDSPAERNFWRLLETQKIPDETYAYVLSIISAAVICEDPKHFGFTFENPLKDI